MVTFVTEEDFIIRLDDKYFRQSDLADEIGNKINCSTTDVLKVLNTLGDVVKDKFSDEDKSVTIKIFPGLKVTSRKILPEQSKSNLELNSDYVFKTTAKFSDDYKKKIRELYNMKYLTKLFQEFSHF